MENRHKVLTPGAMVAKRFFRNRLAVAGMGMLIAMFLFSFVGGMLSPYGEDEQFYTYTMQKKEYAIVTKNDAFRYLIADGQAFDSVLQAKLLLAIERQEETFAYGDVTYTITEEGTELYAVSSGGLLIAAAAKDIVNEEGAPLSFEEKFNALKCYTNKETEFKAAGADYMLDEDGNVSKDGAVVGYISRFVVSSLGNSSGISRDFKEALAEVITQKGETGRAFAGDGVEFDYTDTEGKAHTYVITYDATAKTWAVREETETYVYDRYAGPSKAHWLGTDKNGMDVLTRLMYGGRVSLVIGFIVVMISAVLGILFGGLSGYFGGWADNLIMRIVDVFYCIPSMPFIIILGAAMDAMRIAPRLRMLYLMLVLGFLGWPGIARLVRGQILSLREQEFMTAAESCGISVSRRIFRHLVPNVIPQLIVLCTMELGSAILTEATLSFLGLGVKFPYASWGNIINDVNDAFVMTHYRFIWIPAGICLLISVLGFNFAGDGLRDAFDPKMKR